MAIESVQGRRTMFSVRTLETVSQSSRNVRTVVVTMVDKASKDLFGKTVPLTTVYTAFYPHRLRISITKNPWTYSSSAPVCTFN